MSQQLSTSSQRNPNLFQVSRQSGLLATVGTFGSSQRQGPALRHGGAELKYARLWNTESEAGKSTTIGLSKRPPLLNISAPRNVGPGSYEITGSANKLRSPLDGNEYCTTTMKMKSKFGWKTVGCSPGPVYMLKPTVDPTVMPTYSKDVPLLFHGARHENETLGSKEYVNPGIGPGSYEIPSTLQGSHLRSASMPHIGDTSKGALDGKIAMPERLSGGSKRLLKSTFGGADRFGGVGGLAGQATSSPTGERYYAHNDKGNARRGTGRAPDMGRGQKIDISNPYHGHTFGVSPHTYYPVASGIKKTSPLDGFLSRGLSPMKAAQHTSS